MKFCYPNQAWWVWTMYWGFGSSSSVQLWAKVWVWLGYFQSIRRTVWLGEKEKDREHSPYASLDCQVNGLQQRQITQNLNFKGKFKIPTDLGRSALLWEHCVCWLWLFELSRRATTFIWPILGKGHVEFGTSKAAKLYIHTYTHTHTHLWVFMCI